MFWSHKDKSENPISVRLGNDYSSKKDNAEIDTAFIEVIRETQRMIKEKPIDMELVKGAIDEIKSAIRGFVSNVDNADTKTYSFKIKKAASVYYDILGLHQTLTLRELEKVKEILVAMGFNVVLKLENIDGIIKLTW